MIEEPDRYLEDFAKAGADYVTVHLEATKHIHRTIQLIHDLGMKAGVALNPGTPVSFLEPIIEDLDLVLIMSVNPGFGGQKFIPYTLEKLKQVREMTKGRDILIEVDGGVTLNNVESIIDAGANLLVAGSSVYDGKDATSSAAAFMKVFEKYEA